MAGARYLPLFARAWLIVGPLGLLAIGSQYADRSAELRAYAEAPGCPEGQPPAAGCRGRVEAELVDIDCPDAHQNLAACALRMKIGRDSRVLYLSREAAGRLRGGQQVEVEVFQGLPTGAVIDGALVERSGGPEQAMRTMIWAMVLDIALIVAATAWLLSQRRKATSS